ncbi:MAG: DUF3047 domain-containing protein, partial [Candidatus Binatia bacterium]
LQVTALNLASITPALDVHLLLHVFATRSRMRRLSNVFMSNGARNFLSLWFILANADTVASQTQPGAVQLENFDEYPQLAFPSRWKPHGDHREAAKIYRVEEADGNRFLHAHAETKAIQIGLAYPVAPQQLPRLRWRWRVRQLPLGGDERQAETFDSAAGVYVLFDSRIAPRILKYVWSATVPIGLRLQSPLYWRAKTIILRSGDGALGEWREETVNFYQDYQDLFGREPNEVLGIALLTSADSTKSVAKADYDDFTLLPSEKP